MVPSFNANSYPMSSSLELFSQDIFNCILSYVPESASSLSKTSKRIKDLVDEFLNHSLKRKKHIIEGESWKNFSLNFSPLQKETLKNCYGDSNSKRSLILNLTSENSVVVAPYIDFLKGYWSRSFQFRLSMAGEFPFMGENELVQPLREVDKKIEGIFSSLKEKNSISLRALLEQIKEIERIIEKRL